MNTSDSARYSGKPLLRLLECYVLNAIGHLDDKDKLNLTAMTPKLQEIYKNQGTWTEIIESVMDLPKNMPALIEDMWRKNQKIALEVHRPLAPQSFAEMFVDANLT